MFSSNVSFHISFYLCMVSLRICLCCHKSRQNFSCSTLYFLFILQATSKVLHRYQFNNSNPKPKLPLVACVRLTRSPRPHRASRKRGPRSGDRGPRAQRLHKSPVAIAARFLCFFFSVIRSRAAASGIGGARHQTHLRTRICLLSIGHRSVCIRTLLIIGQVSLNCSPVLLCCFALSYFALPARHRYADRLGNIVLYLVSI